MWLLTFWCLSFGKRKQLGYFEDARGEGADAISHSECVVA
jgi:hypothetical protein